MFLVCGEAVIDLFEDKAGAPASFPGVSFIAKPAGSPFNVCVGLARLGQKAALMTGLSRDAFGGRIIAAMEREGVEWRLAPRTSRPTILSFVLLGADGAPQYAFYGENGADTDVAESALPTPLPDAIRAVHVGGFPMAVEPSRSAYASLIRREANHRFISLDPNIRASLIGDMAAFVPHFEALCMSAALVKASSEDIGLMYPGADFKAIASRWRELGTGTVVITDGPHGAICLNRHGLAFAPTQPVPIIDTVGAGDSFMSALLAGLVDHALLDCQALAAASPQQLEAILAFANKAAGITCTRRGSDPPTRAEIADANGAHDHRFGARPL